MNRYTHKHKDIVITPEEAATPEFGWQLIKQAHPNLESIKIISRLERPEVQDEYTRWTVEALLAEIKSRNVGRDRDSSSSSRSS